MLHELSLRKSAPLIKMNCAAIPASLIEAELFGITRHAATGVDERVGKFQAADGGTLFLDEIGDMPLEIQSKVLRVLEYQVFEKVGSNRSISTDVHLIYATNRNLEKLVDRGEFRKDLFYRINALSIEIPPLRNRPEDIPLLIEHFIKIMATDKNNYPVISSPAMDLLIQYDWPGNVRQLKNLVEKFCILYSGKTIGTMDLPAEIQDISKSGGTKPRALEKAEKMQIRKLLIENDWNQSEVARLLNMPLSTLRRRIKKYKIKKI
jgi:DNA-binding NtrC family response regulator